jgi:hypothetical protein
MWKSLAIKELRESAGIVVLAILGAVYLLGGLTATPVVPWQSHQLYGYPFVSDGLESDFWMLCGALAIALGFRQTAWELQQGTYFFLLHRPVERSSIFRTKLAIGVGLVLTFSAGFILIYALWAASPGHVPAPFDWRMSLAAWASWAALPLLYIGAFLSGIRPGRWFGSRLIPLAAAIGFTALADYSPWLWGTVCISLVGIAFGLTSIFYYVRARDF